jgi:hypothetical protein
MNVIKLKEFRKILAILLSLGIIGSFGLMLGIGPVCSVLAAKTANPFRIMVYVNELIVTTKGPLTLPSSSVGDLMAAINGAYRMLFNIREMEVTPGVQGSYEYPASTILHDRDYNLWIWSAGFGPELSQAARIKYESSPKEYESMRIHCLLVARQYLFMEKTINETPTGGTATIVLKYFSKKDIKDGLALLLQYARNQHFSGEVEICLDGKDRYKRVHSMILDELLNWNNLEFVIGPAAGARRIHFEHGASTGDFYARVLHHPRALAVTAVKRSDIELNPEYVMGYDEYPEGEYTNLTLGVDGCYSDGKNLTLRAGVKVSDVTNKVLRTLENSSIMVRECFGRFPITDVEIFATDTEDRLGNDEMLQGKTYYLNLCLQGDDSSATANEIVCGMFKKLLPPFRWWTYEQEVLELRSVRQVKIDLCKEELMDTYHALNHILCAAAGAKASGEIILFVGENESPTGDEEDLLNDNVYLLNLIEVHHTTFRDRNNEIFEIRLTVNNGEFI